MPLLIGPIQVNRVPCKGPIFTAQNEFHGVVFLQTNSTANVANKNCGVKLLQNHKIKNHFQMHHFWKT